jgi:hypothetical protein
MVMFWEQVGGNKAQIEKEYLDASTKQILEFLKTKKSTKTYGNNQVMMTPWEDVYSRALKEAKKGNPIASYLAMYALKTIWGEQRKPADYKLLAKELYKSKQCEGYISFGKVFEQGIEVKVDYQKALEVYQEGLEKCADISYYGAVLNTGIARVEWKSGRKKR